MGLGLRVSGLDFLPNARHLHPRLYKARALILTLEAVRSGLGFSV